MKVNDDGTYFVQYDDGDKEKHVKAEHVREIVEKKKEEEQVEAKFRGKKWFKGTVMTVNDDGTYFVQYDDGDEEKRVKAEHVRELVEKEKTEKKKEETTASFEVGQQVEAKFRGKKWFKGTIMKVNDDGTYFIQYDDGDKEKRVKSKHIREIESSS